MTYLITFLDNNIKLDVYIEGNIHGLYHYLEIIGYPNVLTTSFHRSHYFGTSYSTNNDKATPQTVIAALHVRQNIIWECCGSIGHKADAIIVLGHSIINDGIYIFSKHAFLWENVCISIVINYDCLTIRVKSNFHSWI